MNSQQFTAELQKQLGSGLVARPYNRFEPADTIWWLVPSTDWPAFKHGKYFVNPIKGSNKFEIGLYIEKGHGSEILKVSGDTAGNRAQVLDDSWLWSQLSEDSSKDLERVLTGLANSEITSKIRLDIGPYSTERSDPDSVQVLQATSIEYVWSESALVRKSESVKSNDKEVQALIDSLPAEAMINDLVSAVNKMEQASWYWFDLLIYFETEIVDGRVVSGLNQFSPWVK